MEFPFPSYPSTIWSRTNWQQDGIEASAILVVIHDDEDNEDNDDNRQRPVLPQECIGSLSQSLASCLPVSISNIYLYQ